MVVINPRTGKEFDWSTNPKPTTMAKWSRKTIHGKVVKGSIRHIAHLDQLNNSSKYKFGKSIEIIQSAWNTTIEASAGTHDKDMTVDLYIPGVSWWTQQAFFRARGLGCWYRPTSSKWSNHIHGFTLPEGSGDVSDDWANRNFKVGIYVDGGWSTEGKLVTSSQIKDYYYEAFGLSGQHKPGSDKSWFPDDKKATVFDLNAYIAKRKKYQASRA